MHEMIWLAFIIMLFIGYIVIKVSSIYQAVSFLQLIIILYVLIGGLVRHRKR